MALDDNDLPEPVQQWLASNLEALRARGLKTRPQLIRQQHSRNKDQLRLFVAFSDSVAPRLYEFNASTHEEFIPLDLCEVLDDPDAFADRRLTDERYFVCTNGQRDACCAIFGMRVYAELSRHCGDAAWQTTHLGGHRFAATLVSLPSGAVYGQLQPIDVAGLLKAHRAGDVLVSKLRGMSYLDSVSQWAEIALRERNGHHQRGRYRLQGQDTLDGVERRVFLDTLDDSLCEIHLRPHPEPLEFQASCGEDTRKRRQLYEVLPGGNT